VLQNILLPVDESPPFEAAFATAIKLAAIAGPAVRIDAFYVLSVSKRKGRLVQDLSGMLGFEPVLVPEKVEAWYRERGERLLADVVERAKQHDRPVKGIWDQGAVVERISHHAAGTDLLIAGVGDDGAVALSGQGEITADRFLKRMTTTVMLLANRVGDFSGICLGYDGSQGSRCALRTTKRLASILECPVKVVYVEDGKKPDGFDPTTEALDALHEQGIEATAHVVSGEAHEVLQAECQEAGFDFLAVGFRGRADLKGRVLGRVTEALVDEMASSLVVSR